MPLPPLDPETEEWAITLNEEQLTAAITAALLALHLAHHDAGEKGRAIARTIFEAVAETAHPAPAPPRVS